jgi:ADP-ribose 1''-phosphate phosphatase
MIEYVKGNLFDAPKGSVLVHACNAQGVWGSGIAVEFKKKFPTSFMEYKHFCSSRNRSMKLGHAKLTSDLVGCLITSNDYGSKVDSPKTILHHTEKAVRHLVEELRTKFNGVVPHIHSNKFNSGLFNVPWAQTEKVLKELIHLHPDVHWTVWHVD